MGSTKPPSGGPGFTDQPDTHSFWSSEVIGAVTVLRFNSNAVLAGINLQSITAFWSFLRDFLTSNRKILHVSMNENDLSPKAIFRTYEYFQNISDEDYLPTARDYRRTTELTRQDVAIQRFIHLLRNDRIFVVGDFSGEIDINYLGLLLACDYRIGSDDTTIVNSGYPVGRTFGTAAPWFLTHLLGSHKAMDILLNCRKISACRARRLGIFHYLTPASLHIQEAIRISQELTARGANRLLAAKKAINASCVPLDAYFEIFGAGISSMDISTHNCQRCGYNLTGNISGKCPECGTAIDQSLMQQNVWSTPQQK